MPETNPVRAAAEEARKAAKDAAAKKLAPKPPKEG
jgi:hypothetical protein